ncbi:MAG: hypothetical protein HN802_01515 [Candidatus Jacksonbacteria bacterium]|nr:hypothetical protein [Candidatus Jacksonbacteria bacterium]
MIFYPDTIALTTPDQGVISASLEIEFDEASDIFSLESRKFSGMYDTTLTDGFASEHPARIVDGQIGSDTELVNGKALYTSGSELFYTSSAEIFRTADTSDVGFMFNLDEEKTTDFIALYINSITGTADVTLYGANSNFILKDSDSKFFYTSGGNLFLTGDDPDAFFSEISSFQISAAGWSVLDYGSETLYTSASKQFIPSGASRMIVLGVGGFTSGVSYKHYLVQFSGSFTIGLGEILLGQKTEPSFNPAMGREYGKEDNVHLKESYDGTEFMFKSGDSAITRKFNWDAVGAADKTAFERLRDKSHHKKFVYYDDDYYFVNLKDMQINEVANGLNSVDMTFAE